MSVHAEIGPIAWVSTRRDVDALIESIWTASTVVFDLETTGLDEHAQHGGESNGGVAARISLASFTLPQADEAGEWDSRTPTTWILPGSHPDSTWLGSWRSILGEVMQAVLDADKPLVGHNVKFDARWVKATLGVDVAHRIAWDTRISSHLLDENRPTRLKVRAPETFDIPPWDDHDLSYPGASEDVPLMELGEYAARDTWWTWRLMENHQERMWIGGDSKFGDPMDPEEMQDARLGQLARWVAMPTVAGLAKVEQRGFKLDVDWVADRLTEDEYATVEALDTLADSYEMDREKASTSASSGWFQELAQRAVDRGDLMVTSLTATGKPQWSKAVLEKQAREGSPAAELVLKVRNASKRAQFLRSWLAEKSADGAIHASYNAGSVVTGRLSSSGPNMQQVTRSLRPAFIPREGFVLAEIDYSQIELRVAAHISQCKPMIDAFNDGQDLHRLLAARIADKKPEDVTKEERQKGKSANFGLLYGMGSYGFQTYAETAYGVDMTIEEAAKVHETFFDQWRGMREWHIRSAKRVRQTGEVASPIGRVRRLPDAFGNDEAKVAAAERNAVNSPVQGFASDLMQMAMASISGTLGGFEAVDGAHVVATVHDSIVVELEEDRWEELLEECTRRMTKGIKVPLHRMGCSLSVPIVADAVVGSRWGRDDILADD